MYMREILHFLPFPQDVYFRPPFCLEVFIWGDDRNLKEFCRPILSNGGCRLHCYIYVNMYVSNDDMAISFQRNNEPFQLVEKQRWNGPFYSVLLSG